MKARFSARCPRFVAVTVAAGVLALFSSSSTFGQKPGSSYAQRAAVFDAQNPRVTAPPSGVRARTEVHRPYYADQRAGQYQNRSIPTIRKRNTGRGSPASMM